MIKRYIVELYKPHAYSHDYNRVHVTRYRTRARAERAAARMLARHPQLVTRAGGGDRRAWGAEIVDARTDRTIAIVDAPVHYVPSVGEIGVW